MKTQSSLDEHTTGGKSLRGTLMNLGVEYVLRDGPAAMKAGSELLRGSGHVRGPGTTH